MTKDRFIKLTNYDDDGFVYIDPEAIQEIVDLPKTDNHPARTRVNTKNQSLYLVKEPAENIHIMIICKKKTEPKST